MINAHVKKYDEYTTMKILKVINALKIQSQVKNHSLLSKMSLFTLSPTLPPPNSHTHSGGVTVPFKTRE